MTMFAPQAGLGKRQAGRSQASNITLYSVLLVCCHCQPCSVVLALQFVFPRTILSACPPACFAQPCFLILIPCLASFVVFFFDCWRLGALLLDKHINYCSFGWRAVCPCCLDVYK